MKSALAPAAALLTVVFAANADTAPLTMKLWPEGVPSPMPPKSAATAKLIQSYGGAGPNRLTDVTEPTITVYKPKQPNGTAVIVAPGGGFMFLSYRHEGVEVCEWLNTLGVTAILLKYRTPTRDDAQMHEKPTQDALRALGLVRHHAAEWQIDPNRVGVLGFSAGANLAGHAAWDRGSRNCPQNFSLEDSRGPDFLFFIYGGGFLDKEDKTRFRADFAVPADAPPAFFLVAHDDKANPVEATKLYLEYRKKNRPTELHVFAKGGHGFGMRKNGHPINDWPQRCAEWMRSMGWIGLSPASK